MTSMPAQNMINVMQVSVGERYVVVLKKTDLLLHGGTMILDNVIFHLD